LLSFAVGYISGLQSFIFKEQNPSTFGFFVVFRDDQDKCHHNDKNQQIPKSI